MQTTNSIRTAQTSDILSLHRIINEAYISEKSWTSKNHATNTERISIAELQRLLTIENQFIFVLTDETETLIACIRLDAAENDRFPETCTIGLLAVAPHMQSKGIGGLMLKHSMTYARDQLALKSAIVRVVNDRKDLLDWYQRLGFSDTYVTTQIDHERYFVILKKTIL